MAIKKTPTLDSSEQQKKPSSSMALSSSGTSGCCKGTTQCSAPVLTKEVSPSLFTTTGTKPATTQIVIKYDVGFNNHLFLRGKGANLSWEKGIPLKNVKRDEWTWETSTPFSSCEFKVLINDIHYETGENHKLNCGASVHYTPKF
ncbi:MAG: hypothetical protein WCF65_00655 [Parachlamydiaceae bacterium]